MSSPWSNVKYAPVPGSEEIEKEQEKEPVSNNPWSNIKYSEPEFIAIPPYAKTHGGEMGRKAFAKKALSSSLLGFPERERNEPELSTIPPYAKMPAPIKLSEEEEKESGAKLAGEAVGMSAPFSLAVKGAKLFINPLISTIPGLLPSSATTGAVTAGTAGALYETAREKVSGEEISPEKIGETAALTAGIESLITASPAIGNWFKSLLPAQKKQFLSGKLPENMDRTKFNLFKEETAPALRKIGEERYANAEKEEMQRINDEFQKKMDILKSEQAAEITELEMEGRLTKEIFEKEKADYQKLEAERDYEIKQAQDRNAQKIQEYQDGLQEYEDYVKRGEALDQANAAQEEATILNQPREATPKEEIGNIISDRPFQNSDEGGVTVMNGVKAHDRIDYARVNEKYKLAENAMEKIQLAHPNTLNKVENLIAEMSRIDPELLTPMQKKLLQSAKNVKSQLGEFDPETGDVIGHKSVPNTVLMNDAKTLRNSMSYDFSHGESPGILKPLVNILEDAVEQAAIQSGNKQALKLHQRAKRAYSDWADTYNNDYIRTLRNESNKDYSRSYEGMLNTDNYQKINRILFKSNEGQLLNNKLRRDLVLKEVGDFFENPTKHSPQKFDETLKELRPALKEEGAEEALFREAYLQQRKRPIPEVKEKPKEPKLEKIPQPLEPFKKEYKAPEYKKKEKVTPPEKEELKPTKQMQAAAKLAKITPEQAMKLADTPTGLEKLKKLLPERLFNDVVKHQTKKILYKGNIRKKFKAKEMYEQINTENNLAMISEMLGDDKAIELLNTLESMKNVEVTIASLTKFGMKLPMIRLLLKYGILIP